jgi:tRNA(Arg) A34 adenosine deaminase TadA
VETLLQEAVDMQHVETLTDIPTAEMPQDIEAADMRVEMLMDIPVAVVMAADTEAVMATAVVMAMEDRHGVMHAATILEDPYIFRDTVVFTTPTVAVMCIGKIIRGYFLLLFRLS